MRFPTLLGSTILILVANSSAAGDLMVGVIPSDGTTLLVKQFAIAARTSIEGLEFRSNDDRTIFPEVILVRDAGGSLNEGALVARATSVGATSSGMVRIYWEEPVRVDEAGTYSAAVRIPRGLGKESLGTGPAIGGYEVTAASGSFVAGGPDGELTALRVDLSISLIAAAAGKVASEASPSETFIPTTFLGTGQPNPASSMMRVRFGVDRPSFVQIAIYDIAGHQVRTLVNGWLNAGEQTVIWDGRDSSGRSVGAGVYISRMSAGAKKLSQKVVITK